MSPTSSAINILPEIGLVEVTADTVDPLMSYDITLYQSESLLANDNFKLESDPVNPIRLDAVVASLRLEVSEPPTSRIEPGLVTMELLSGLFYFQEEIEVALSVVLSDGRRLIIIDPGEILIISSNNSIVSVDNNVVIAQSIGDVVLNVSWVVCGEVLLSQDVSIEVRFDQFQPIFDPASGSVIVSEDRPIGTVITQVEAVDQDNLNVHAGVQYTIKDDPYDGLFLVDLTTGKVTLNFQLDREVQENYQLLIEATDQFQRQQLMCVNPEPTTAPTSVTTPTTAATSSTTPMTTPTPIDIGSGSGIRLDDDRLLPETEEPNTTATPPTDPPMDQSCPEVAPISVFNVS